MRLKIKNISNFRRHVIFRGIPTFGLLLLLLVGCSGQSLVPDQSVITLKNPRPVVLDLDMAHGDIIAALFLIAHPNVEVKGITVVGSGEVHCEAGLTNALGVTNLMNRPEIPVACGGESPLVGDHSFPASWRQAADEVYGVSIPSNTEPSALPSADLLIDLLKSSEEKISIVAVGPLTNVAEAIQSSPEIIPKIEMIYIMGGAVKVEGNVGPSGLGINNEYAEWNIYIDPAAANIVFESGAPVTLVPLDATRNVPITRSFYTALKQHRNTKASALVYEILSANLDFIDSGGFQFWDSLTAAIFTDESLAVFEEFRLTIVEKEGQENGRTKPAEQGIQVQVAVKADRARFEQLLISILNWPLE